MSNDSFSPAHGLNPRGLLVGAGGIAAAGALSTAAIALPAGFAPSADFHEIRRVAGLAQHVWQSDLDDDAKHAEIAKIEVSLAAIEMRVMSTRPVTLQVLLDRAALALYWSDAGAAGFHEPVEALRRAAADGDCFESRALELTAAIFEAAVLPSADARFESWTQPRSTSC